MCYGFSVLYCQDGSVKWICPDKSGDISHSDILSMADLDLEIYKSVFLRTFVRIEFSIWTDKSFKVDEHETLPAWFDFEDCVNSCRKLLHRVRPIWRKYQRIFSMNIELSRRIQDEIWNKYYNLATERYTAGADSEIDAESERFSNSQHFIWQQMYFELQNLPGFIEPKHDPLDDYSKI